MNKLKLRNLFAAAMLCMLLLTLIVPTAFAATVNVLDGKVSITDSAGSNTVSGGTVTIKAKGNFFSKKTNNITIKNETTDQAALSFGYTAANYSSFTIEGASVASSGSYSVILDAGASVSLSLVSNSGFSNTTATLTLSNFSLTVVAASSNVTFEFDSNFGSVTVGGSAVTSGASHSVSYSDGVVLVATPTNSATFLGWVNTANGNILSTATSFTLNPPSAMTVKAVFAHANATAWFEAGGGLYDTLSAAAETGDTSIVLAASGTLLAGTHDIPSGYTLLIPRDASDTGSYAKTETTGTKATAFRTLTIPSDATLNVKGTLINNATISSADGGKPHSGEVTGAYGRIVNNGTINVESGGKWYCRGYADGEGTANIKSGAALYQPMVVQDWRGGSATSSVSGNVFPLNVYSMINVMCCTQYEYGSALYVVGQLKVILNALDEVEAQVLGTADGCIFQMTEGCVVESKFNKSERKMEYSATAGTLNLAYMDVSVSIDSMSSKNTVVPFNDMFIINVENGATVNVTYAAKLLPGAVLNVKDGGTLNVTGSLYVYRGNDFAVTYANSQYFALPNNDIFSNAARYSSLAGVNAQVNVYGTGKITGNIYVSSKTGDISGVVHCINGGTFSTSATANTTINEHVSTSKSIETVAFSPANGHAVHEANSITAPDYSNGGYKYNVTVVAPTCNVDGYTKHQCSVCDYSYNDTEVNALGHSYEDNSVICTVCGLFEFYASNVHLGNSLDMMFAFPASAFVTNADLGGYYVKVVRTYADSSPVESKIYASSWSSTKINNVDYYVVIYKGFAAKEMCDSVSLTVCRETTSKEEELSTVWTDSIQQYAMRMLSNHSDNQTLCTLLVDMLNYGAACQKHFAAQENKDIADDGLANAKLSDQQKTVDPETIEWSKDMPIGSDIYETNLIVNSNIRFAVSGADGTSSFTFKNHWVTENPDYPETLIRSGCMIPNTENDYYYINKLFVADTRQKISITVDGTTFEDSIEAYCYRMIHNTDTTETQKVVCTAFMKFSNSAYNYLHDVNGEGRV